MNTNISEEGGSTGTGNTVTGGSPTLVCRECHGFSNPRGSQVGVVTGVGAGWKFTPLKNPHPCHGFEGFLV